MTGDTIECFNCGHENPSWAQVCRSCGFALQAAAPVSTGPRGLFPTDQASLTSIGGAMGAILGAIILGLILSGLIPPAPNIAEETPSPTPSASASASPSVLPSAVGSVLPSLAASPQLPGTVTFGTGWNNNTRQLTGETTTFSATSDGFAHEISLSEPFGVDRLQEEVVRVAADGTETIVQPRNKGVVLVNPSLSADGLESGATVSQLIAKWGKGDHILRVYRGDELLAEGHFTFT
jgi:hypothetical protein